MIVIDESIHEPAIIHAIAVWYQGQVLSVRKLRPGTLIKDDGVPALLNQVTQPTFVTINVIDFWRKVPADRRFCIIALEIAQDQTANLPNVLRRLLRLTEFSTKAARMGKVIHVMPTYIEYYAADRQIQRIAWADSL